jgi:hypothetical protein
MKKNKIWQKSIWVKVLVLVLSLTLISSLKVINLLSELQKTKTGDVSVYDQEGMPWTAEDLEGILQLKDVSSASDEDIALIDPMNIYAIVCGYPEHKPDVTTTNCADFGVQVNNISWQSWDGYGASGRGVWSVNQCEPDCASGTRIGTPVEVRLSKLMTDGKRFFLTSFNAYPEDYKQLQVGWTLPWQETEINVPE